MEGQNLIGRALQKEAVAGGEGNTIGRTWTADAVEEGGLCVGGEGQGEDARDGQRQETALGSALSQHQVEVPAPALTAGIAAAVEGVDLIGPQMDGITAVMDEVNLTFQRGDEPVDSTSKIYL